MTDSVISLLLNWGPIIGIAFFPVQSCMLTINGGFKRATQLGAGLTLAGALIRTIPCWLGEDFRQNNVACLLLLHIGQILNAAAGPLCMGTESRLSCIWFAENERATATATAVTANGLGTTLGFILGPYTASSADRIPLLLYIEILLTAVPFVCSLTYFPSAPPEFPSAAAAAEALKEKSDADELEQVIQNTDTDMHPTYWEGMRLCARNTPFLLLVSAAGLLAGASAGWQSLLQDIIGYDDTTVGWLGFANGLAGNLGAILIGFLSDKLFRFRFKAVILSLLLFELVVMVWFSMSLPMFTQDSGMLPHSIASIGIAIGLLGLAQSATSPLFYELCAELTFPVPEGTSAGILALLWNTASFVIIFLSPVISSKCMNPIMTGCIVVVLLMVLAVKEVYKRPRDDPCDDRDIDQNETSTSVHQTIE